MVPNNKSKRYFIPLFYAIENAGIKSNLALNRIRIKYCPSFDGQFDNLSKRFP